MRRLLLAVTLLTWTSLASAQGVGDLLAGSTLTCSTTLKAAGCFLERPAFVLGPLEFAFGVDAQAAWSDGRSSYLAPYGIVGWYAERWAAWLEFAIPESRVPIIGKPDAFRFGFTYRFP